MTINGKQTTAEQFAFDGCHKIYLLDDEAAAEDARNTGYSILPIEELPAAYERSCVLRFISNWNLEQDDYVGQFEDAVIEAQA